MTIDVEQRIGDYVQEYSGTEGVGTRWRKPIVGYAQAQDVRFAQLKQVVRATHLLPTDLLKEAKTVVAYFLPFAPAIAHTNTVGRFSSRDWAIAYIETNRLISGINKALSELLAYHGYECVHVPATHNFDEDSLMSDWSHRHVAHISGLGTFGLNNMLITNQGCCGRFGSFVTNLEIPCGTRFLGTRFLGTRFLGTRYVESGVESSDGQPHCLYHSNGGCQKCVKQCWSGALQVGSFDRHRCYAVLLANDRQQAELGVSDVCGKCCVDLPCSLTNPVRSGGRSSS